MSKHAYMTLDLESDYCTDQFLGLQGVPRLVDFCLEMEIPLTVFVEGRVLRQHPQILSRFPKSTEFGLHCNNHEQIPDSPAALREGAQSFADFFGYRPLGYRAGKYRLTKELLDALAKEGFHYDASYIPGASGVDLGQHSLPFKLENGLWEIPVGRWPVIEKSFAMSRVSLLGMKATKIMRNKCDWPELPIFVFHMVDVYPTPALKEATLIRKLGHSWNYRFGTRDPFERFENFVRYMKADDFTFRHCGSLVSDPGNGTSVR